MQVHGLHPHRGNWYLYITCLYWSVMTLSTVGYGDISPNTTEEKIFTIVVIFTGVSGYAMLIQAIGTAMAGDPNKLSHTKAMRNYLYDYEVPPDLAKRILHFLRLRDKKMRQEYIEPEVDLCIETLSKPLRRRLVLHTRRDLVGRVPWFLGRPMKFVADVCPLLKSVVASPLEVVGATGVSASALVFVVKGDLAAFEHASATPKCATPKTIKHGLSDLSGDIDKELLAYEAADRDSRYTWGPDSTFGLPGCVLDKTWRLDIIALDDCEMLAFPKEALLELLGEHDHAAILPELVREAEESVAEHPALFSDGDERDADRPSSPPSRRDATASPTPEEAKSSYACDRLVARRADVAAFLAQHISPASLSADDESAALVRDFVEAHSERPPERVPPTTETRRSPRQSPPAPARLPRSPDEDSPAELWAPSTEPPRARPVIVEDASTGPRARSVVVDDAPPPDDDNPAEMLCGALVGGDN